MKRYIFFILLFFGGCSPPGLLLTNSGKPEVTIPRRTVQEVSNALADWSLSHGFNIIHTTFFSLEGERIADSSSALHNINIGSHERVFFNYAETPSGVHIIGDFLSRTEELGDIVERRWLQNELSTISQKLSAH